MSKVNDIEYAFPQTIKHEDRLGNPMGTTIYNGMTLRQYIATAAMQGMLSTPAAKGYSPEKVALWSIAYTDALIAELQKENKNK